MPQIDPKRLVLLGLLLIIVSIASLFGGFYFNRRVQTLDPKPALVDNKSTVKTSLLFQNQTATLQASITKVDNNLLTITNDKDVSDSFSVSPSVIIYKQTKLNPPESSASADLKTIELNKSAFIVLQVLDGKYQIISISYLIQPKPISRKK